MRPILIIFSLIYFFVPSIFAQVHVGNGGGEAENIVLQMSLGAPYWAKACNENPGLCGDFQFSPSDIKAFSSKVSFAPLKAISSPCTPDSVIISHESLYIDLDKPKSNSELVEVLIKTILTCHGYNATALTPLRFLLDPRMKVITNYSLILFSSPTGDIITAAESGFPVQNALATALSCTHFRIIRGAADNLSVICLENQYQYVVYIRQAGSNYRFIARIDSGD